MIAANELRIGNFIKYIAGENELIYHITEAVEIDSVTDNPLYQPIPLTPEILKKAGFEYKLLDQESTKETFNLFFEDIILQVDRDKIVWLNESPLTNIHYLHQLQNLYFALTGEELIIDL